MNIPSHSIFKANDHPNLGEFKNELNETESADANDIIKEISNITITNSMHSKETELTKEESETLEKDRSIYVVDFFEEIKSNQKRKKRNLESPITITHDHVDPASKVVNDLTLELFEKINLDHNLIHLAEFSNVLLRHSHFQESHSDLLDLLLKIAPNSTIEERSLFLESLEKKAVLDDDFSILNSQLLDRFNNEEINLLKNHLEIELADTRALFKLIFETIHGTSPEFANFLLGTLDLNAQKLLKKNTSISLFRSSVLKNIAEMIKEAKSLNIDLSKISDLHLLSCKRSRWRILTAQTDEESESTKNNMSHLMTLGPIGQGSINKVNLVWDRSRSTFFAMRTADDVSYEKIRKGIEIVEEIRGRCLFNDGIAKPGELIVLEKNRDVGVQSYYASLEELAIHRDLAQQFSLFRDHPRELMIQLIEQFVELQKSRVALIDIKPANMNVYEMNGKHVVKFSDLDGAKTAHSIKRDLHQAWQKWVEFHGDNPDTLKDALKNLTEHGNPSLVLDFSEEGNVYRLFRKSIIDITSTYISPGYSTGSREYGQKMLFENTKYVFAKLSEIDTTQQSFDDVLTEIADGLVNRFQKLDCHCIGSSLLEVLVDLSEEEKRLRYKLLKDAFLKESILKYGKMTEPVAGVNSLISSEPISDSISTRGENPYSRNYRKGKRSPSVLKESTPIVQSSAEEALITLKEKIDEYLIKLPDNAKLPVQTSEILLDLISGNLSNNEEGLARLTAFIDEMKQLGN